MSIRNVAGFIAALVWLRGGLAQAPPCPEVLPPHAVVEGRTVGEWGSLFWQWSQAFPDKIAPQNDPTGERCALGQEGKVWFLEGGFGGGGSPTVREKCVVPQGTFLVVPIFNWFYASSPGDLMTCQEACQRALLE